MCLCYDIRNYTSSSTGDPSWPTLLLCNWALSEENDMPWKASNFLTLAMLHSEICSRSKRVHCLLCTGKEVGKSPPAFLTSSEHQILRSYRMSTTERYIAGTWPLRFKQTLIIAQGHFCLNPVFVEYHDTLEIQVLMWAGWLMCRCPGFRHMHNQNSRSRDSEDQADHYDIDLIKITPRSWYRRGRKSYGPAVLSNDGVTTPFSLTTSFISELLTRQ